MDLYTKNGHSIKKKSLPIIFICLASLFFASRTTLKNPYYFKNIPGDTSINTTINRLSESVIRRNEQLAINISSLNLRKTCLQYSNPNGGQYSIDGYRCLKRYL